MKRYYLILLIIFTFPQFSVAQSDIGLKGGVNLSKPFFNKAYNPWEDIHHYKIGYHVGLFSSFKLTDIFYLAPEFLISEKGTKNLAATYISVPTLMNFRILDKFIIEAGPEFELLLFDGKFFNKHIIQMWKKGFSIGMNIGAKMEVSNRMIANIRYNYGLSTVMDGLFITDEKGYIIDEVKVYNRNFQISVGYKINN